MPAKGAGIFYRTESAINRRARLLVLLAGVLLCSFVWAQQTAPVPDPLKPQYTEKGAEKCLLCHSELRMELIAETPHGDRSNPDAPFAKHDCESCHGPGSFHVSRSRRGKGRPPMVTFGKDAKTSLENQALVCLGCHSQDMGALSAVAWDSIKHRASATCIDCHTMHSEGGAGSAGTRTNPILHRLSC